MERERACCLKFLDLILTQMCQVCLANYKLNWMLGLFTAFWGQVGWVLGCDCLRALQNGSCLRLFMFSTETFLSSQFSSITTRFD